MALVRSLRIPQLVSHLLRVCHFVPCLVHSARTTPPDIIKPLVLEFDLSLRPAFTESISRLTDAGWSKLQLPFREQGGAFADLGSIVRLAYTASIMDTARYGLCSATIRTPLPSSSPSSHRSGTLSRAIGPATNQTFNLQTSSAATAKSNQQSAVS
jgi:hypothetical protein